MVSDGTVMNWLYWAPFGAASLHIVEEFVYPGGFAEWDRRYRPGFQQSITPRLHVIVNGLLLVACYDVWAFRSRPMGPAVWLTVTTLLFANAVWHVAGTLRSREYSPGVVTGVLLYVPLTVYGYVHFLLTGQASVPAAILAFLIGVSYQLWVGKALHRWRVGRAKT
jgi:hypothetical protein